MLPLAEKITLLLSWLTLIMQLVILFFSITLLLVIFKFPSKILHHLSKKASEHALLTGLIISLVGLAASLIYSNFFGFPPCELCWWQRVFLYPQVIIFAIAYFNKVVNNVEDEMVFLYSLVLSVCGAGVSLFQYYGQMFNPDLLSGCASQGVSCSKVLFVSFGYITMPMMSLTAYIILILSYFFKKKIKI